MICFCFYIPNPLVRIFIFDVSNPAGLSRVSCLGNGIAVQCPRPGPNIGNKSPQIPRYSPVCPRGQPRDGHSCSWRCSYIKHSVPARLLSCKKFKMVVNTEILLQAWRERWTPLQWLVQVKKLAGKDKKDLDNLAGYLKFKPFIFWQHIVTEVFETEVNPVSFCKLSLLIWYLSSVYSIY